MLAKRTLLFFFYFPLLAFSQQYSQEQVIKDLEYLIKQIENFNPALEAYNPDFKKQVSEIVNSIDGELSTIDLFRKISEIATLSNEGHFGLGTWEDEAHKGLLDNTFKYMPLAPVVNNGQIYVWDAMVDGNSFEQGDQILEINGRSAKEILDILYRHVPSDGGVIPYKQNQLSKGFAWMYFLYVEQPETFEVKLRKYKTGDTQLAICSALSIEQRDAKRKSDAGADEQKESKDQVYEFKVSDAHALLTLKTFSRRLVEKYAIEADQLYEKIFKELKESGTKELIVDLRNNNGGRNEFYEEILPYLTDKKGVYKTSISWKGKEKKHKYPSKSKYAFEGSTYVLINGGTFSAGSVLARFFKEYTNATLIGEEAGGRYEGFAGGSAQYVFLPNSKYRVTIPRYHAIFHDSQRQKTSNRGALPDYEVVPTIDDLINERDVVMEKALELLGLN